MHHMARRDVPRQPVSDSICPPPPLPSMDHLFLRGSKLTDHLLAGEREPAQKKRRYSMTADAGEDFKLAISLFLSNCFEARPKTARGELTVGGFKSEFAKVSRVPITNTNIYMVSSP